MHASESKDQHGSYPSYLLSENQVDSEENRALFHAALDGNLRGVKNALQRGAKPNFFFRPEDNKNALHVASEFGHLEVVNELLEHGAEVDALSGKDHYTALILAAIHGKTAVVRRLLKAGASVSASTSNCGVFHVLWLFFSLLPAFFLLTSFSCVFRGFPPYL